MTTIDRATDRVRAVEPTAFAGVLTREATIFRSKAVGEPPLMLATAVWTALKDAIGAVGGGKVAVRLDAPATPERVIAAGERVPRAARPAAP